MGHACHPIPFFFPTAVWLPHDLSHVVLMRRMIYFVRQFIAAFLFHVVIDMPIVPKRNSVTCGFLVGIWSYYRMFAILRVQIAAKDLCGDLGQNLGPRAVQEGVRCTRRRSARGYSGSSAKAA